ncbi:hypothetical protein GGTG_07994 [Gaeumannomyces tritici R3-111a-1]|uniref:Uncharacterized protein n=1 Tax=Gaeumannomyces tritici (strain R3-111a-1) TaxID=644352 RepID=J3P3A6_GAET3|nr:hypothetical protein GGTG_07994 [Gaeumannomyces tritici R3-111a-1]EJT74148.1 hypothetical protein GGTG_07994 [Gaeumannomyces tritici R3-111a-1]
MNVLDRFGKWVQLKAYQVEVTYSVYMFTPAEKFIFWSIVFLVHALTIIATILYMPHHIAFLANRAWFYINGDSVDVVGLAKDAVHTLVATNAAAAAATSSSSISTAARAAATMVREL